MADPFVNLIVGFVIGAASGAFSAYLGWNKSGEPFDPKKFISGLVTGVIAGIAFVLGVSSIIQSTTDQAAIVIQYVTIVLGILGVDQLRTSISGAITKEPTTATV